jgi:hypothetical protein
MALYEVRHLVEERRGVEVERFELLLGGAYITGIDVPKSPDGMWFHHAAKRIRANLLNRAADAAPVFGAAPGQAEALTFAEMLNA